MKPAQPYIFIHINKTGGSSVEQALGLPFRHVTVKEHIASKGRELWDTVFKFTIVRNPWDKVTSHYHYRVMTGQTGLGMHPIGLPQWVKLAYGQRDPGYYDVPRLFMPQTDWLEDDAGLIALDFIARFENLKDDFDTVCRRLNVTATLPHLKASPRGDYRRYFDSESIDVVASVFRRDIETFSYQFE